MQNQSANSNRDPIKVEYRVKPVTRFIITRHVEYADSPERPHLGNGFTQERGEHPNADMAFEVAYALCRAEHESLGWPLGDERIKYPTGDTRYGHASDCSMNNGPAMEEGPCDCGYEERLKSGWPTAKGEFHTYAGREDLSVTVVEHLPKNTDHPLGGAVVTINGQSYCLDPVRNLAG